MVGGSEYIELELRRSETKKHERMARAYYFLFEWITPQYFLQNL